MPQLRDFDLQLSLVVSMAHARAIWQATSRTIQTAGRSYPLLSMTTQLAQ